MGKYLIQVTCSSLLLIVFINLSIDTKNFFHLSDLSILNNVYLIKRENSNLSIKKKLSKI